jgi:hypothetical protein
MQPVRRIAEIARDERAKKAVKTGSAVFGVVKNVAAIGAVGASVIGGYFATQNKANESAQTPQPTVAATASIDPLSLTAVRGKLAFDLVLKPGGTDVSTPPPQTSANAQPTAEVRATADGIEIAPVRGGGYAPIPLRRTLPTKNVTEVDLSIAAGTEMTFTWALRFTSGRQYAVIIDALQEQLTFRYTDTANVSNNKILSPVVTLAGLQRGRVARIALAASGSRFLLYLDGDLVADLSDDRIPEAPTPTSTIGMGAAGAKGSFVLRGMRVYQIAEVLAPKSR